MFLRLFDLGLILRCLRFESTLPGMRDSGILNAVVLQLFAEGANVTEVQTDTAAVLACFCTVIAKMTTDGICLNHLQEGNTFG